MEIVKKYKTGVRTHKFKYDGDSNWGQSQGSFVVRNVDEGAPLDSVRELKAKIDKKYSPRP